MSNPDEDESELSELSDCSSNLPAAAAALSAEDRYSLVNALKEKLQNLAGRHCDVMETLSPKVRKRVQVLQELQGHYNELADKFFEERAALEEKYDKLYEPLYSKRNEIVNAVVEVDEVTESFKDEESDNEGESRRCFATGRSDNEGESENGVPKFWFFALKTNEVLGREIFKRDEEALTYLKDIKLSKLAYSRGSFILEFFFDPNPFFKNSVLTKTYIMMYDDETDVSKAIGTQIEWHPGKCITMKLLRKKLGSINEKPITKVVKCDSFFNFFNPPQLPDEDDDDEMDIETAEDLENLVDHDYDVGATIRNKIIPYAVSWFTGEAAQHDTYYDRIENSDGDHDEDYEDVSGLVYVEEVYTK